jgi:hypothetical protein
VWILGPGVYGQDHQSREFRVRGFRLDLWVKSAKVANLLSPHHQTLELAWNNHLGVLSEASPQPSHIRQQAIVCMSDDDGATSHLQGHLVVEIVWSKDDGSVAIVKQCNGQVGVRLVRSTAHHDL